MVKVFDSQFLEELLVIWGEFILYNIYQYVKSLYSEASLETNCHHEDILPLPSK